MRKRGILFRPSPRFCLLHSFPRTVMNILVGLVRHFDGALFPYALLRIRPSDLTNPVSSPPVRTSLEHPHCWIEIHVHHASASLCEYRRVWRCRPTPLQTSNKYLLLCVVIEPAGGTIEVHVFCLLRSFPRTVVYLLRGLCA